MSFAHRFSTNFRFYLVAVLTVAAAAGVRYALGPVLGGTIPVVLFTLPVALAAIWGGVAPGIFATLISAAVSAYLFIPPLNSFKVAEPSGMVAILTFLAIGLALSAFGQRMRNLQADLAEQAARLARINQDLELNNKGKDEFLAMLAHELRNPLAGISTAAELLKLAHSDHHKLARTGDIIRRQVRHMTKLVDDLLDVSRVTRGLAFIDKAPVDLRESVYAAIEQVRSAVESKQQRLTVELPGEEAPVLGDRVRLTQVISNLLSNANKYSSRHGSIGIALALSAESAVLTISDDGQGIDPGLLPSMFGLFVQAERTPDRSQGGLGIGLALVKKIVELHDGQVMAYSAGTGKGSRFSIALPRIPSSPKNEVQPTGREAGTAPVAALAILVVDDNQDAADTTAMLLRASGHEVLVEYSALGALRQARAGSFGAVILDIGLPEMDGHALCRRMKALPHLENAVFIALSGYGQESDRRRSIEAGFDHHLVKPAGLDELTRVLVDGSRGRNGYHTVRGLGSA